LATFAAEMTYKVTPSAVGFVILAFLFDTTDGQLWYDADGSAGGGTAELVATVDNFASYTYDANDFTGWS
jgi:hypothetical protein